MKHLIFFIVLINVYSSCFPQNKIKGIGIFKIGETKINVINQILEDNNTELENCNSVKQDRWLKFRMDFTVAELFPNITDIDLDPLLTCFCPDVRVFFIKEYTIAGIYLSNIHLRFYKNTLIEFYCDDSDDLLQALTTKFGNPKRLDKWDKISGFNFSDNTKYSSLYWNNDPIFASFNYETDASGENDFYFVIRDISYDKTIKDCETQRKDAYIYLERERLKDIKDKKEKDILNNL